MADPYLGEIRMFAGGAAPSGWAPCDGQLLPINQYQPLFSLLGTTYGGDGVSSFALPDLRGRAPFHAGVSLSLGARGGEEAHALTAAELPAHSHTAHAAVGLANTSDPTGSMFADAGVSMYTTDPPNIALAALSNTGGSQPHPNLAPYLTVCFAISLAGSYPA